MAIGVREVTRMLLPLSIRESIRFARSAPFLDVCPTVTPWRATRESSATIGATSC